MPAQVLTSEDLQAALSPILQRLAFVEASMPDMVDTQEALRITGIKSDNTLKAERERLNTLIRFRKEGKKVLYFRSSLIDYCLKKQGETPESVALRIAS